MPDCIVETIEGVMLLRFNRPDAMNSMGGTMIQEMNAALEEGRRDDRVRAFVFTGEGRGWCSGADLSAMNRRNRGEVAAEPEERFDKRVQALDTLGNAGRTTLAIHNLDKPTIAAVNGVAVGAGFGLCTSMDIRIASEQARFGTIFIRRALGPDFGLSWFLPRLVGPEAAAELFYTGRIVDAREAKALGIVSKVVPHEKLLDEAMTLAHMLANFPPAALTYTRRALKNSINATLEQQLAFEWANQSKCLASEEFREGVAAFIEKREPDFSRF